MMMELAASQGRTLPVMEHFYTLQGEGFHTGRAAYFIRLAGCDVGCHWCDVQQSWQTQGHPLLQVETLADQASTMGGIVVVTGGEPLMWNLDFLTHSLKSKGCRTHMETSGAHPLSGDWDWITLSPKKRSLPQEEIYAHANELKIIIFNQDDFRFAQEQAERVSPTCQLYLQVEWSKKAVLSDKIVDYIKAHPQWQLSLQTHKYIHIP